MKRLSLLALTALVVLASTAMADNSAATLGTAGKFRTVKVDTCGKTFPEQLSGACDPEPVDTALPAPQQIEAHLARAIKLVSFMRMPQAREAADAAIALDPKNVAALKFRARLAATMMDSRTASNDINTALDLAPKDADLLATRAELRSDLEVGLQDATAAVDVQTTNADAHWIRARILYRLNRVEEAVADLDQALAAEPGFFTARILRARSYLRLSKVEDASRDADQALRDSPNHMDALEVRASARFVLGQLPEAVEDFTAVLGPPGDRTRPPPTSARQQDLLLQRLITLVQLHRDADAKQDLDMMLLTGGLRGILRLQLFLRRNGFPDVVLDGKRTDNFDEALRSCFVQRVCWQGLVTQKT